MKIFSLRWAMQNISFLMNVKPKGLLEDVKKLMLCIQCNLKICISILIFTFYIINQICHKIKNLFLMSAATKGAV